MGQKPPATEVQPPLSAPPSPPPGLPTSPHEYGLVAVQKHAVTVMLHLAHDQLPENGQNHSAL